MVLLIPALLLPFVAVSAGGATITASPGTAYRGDTLVVRGENFPKGDATILWDGDPNLGNAFSIRGSGAFRTTITVPRSLAAGTHEVFVVSSVDSASASATVAIKDASAPPAPAPTPVPTRVPRPKATAAPKPTATPTPTATPARAPAPTTTPTTTTPATTPPPTVAPTLVPDLSTGKSVRVASIVSLKAALADNTVDEIVVADGTYAVATAQSQVSNSLYIGPAFASRTRPVVVRAETLGGVTFDGGGSARLGIVFLNGAHDQTWRGFHFANMLGTAVEFGGFTPSAPPHDITLQNIWIDDTNHIASGSFNQEHAFYFSWALGRGPYNLLLEDISIIGAATLPLWGGIHGYHGQLGSPAPDHVTIRRLTTRGIYDPIVLWYDTAGNGCSDWLIEGADIQDAKGNAIRYETVGATNMVFKDITSTGSGESGFYSSLGAIPPGVTFINDSLR